MFKKKVKFFKIIVCGCLGVAIVTLFHIIRKEYLFDFIVVRGESMIPTFQSGEKVFVNKMLLGARVYKSRDFDKGILDCFRIPGIRGLNVGDVALFNMPYGQAWGRISFKHNYLYVKRCVGCPGDTISIINCQYFNSRMGNNVGIPDGAVSMLRSVPNLVLLEEGSLQAGHFAGMDTIWTIKDFGPLAIPAKGFSVVLDSVSVARYSKVFEYELGSIPLPNNGLYTFLHDYYFFAGDNMINSRDSRYFGLVPDDYIVGIVPSRPHIDHREKSKSYLEKIEY